MGPTKRFSVLTPFLICAAVLNGDSSANTAHYYYPLPGNSLINHSRRAPHVVGLDGDVADEINAFLQTNPYRRGSRPHASRWALWRHGYLVHVEGDFLKKQDVASLRKTWHALTVGAALKQGRIDSLDERISKYQTELTGNDALATWKHVMIQCAGFDYPVGPYPDFKPGEMWTYADYNPHHLCHALAKVYGQIDFFDHYDTVIEKAYFGAIGMTDWYSRNKVDHGTRMADGSPMWDGPRLVINMEHMGRLGLLVLARGSWNGVELIPASFVRALETKQTQGMLTNDRSPYGNPHVKRDREAEKRESPYGFMTWVNSDGDLFPGADRHWARASGAGGTIVLWNHTNGYVFVGSGIQSLTDTSSLPLVLEGAIQGENPLIQEPAVPRIGQFCHSHILAGHEEPFDASADSTQLRVAMTKPNGIKRVIKASHYRDNLWRIPIAPDILGVWQYQAEFSDGSPGTTGRFECVPSPYSDVSQKPAQAQEAAQPISLWSVHAWHMLFSKHVDSPFDRVVRVVFTRQPSGAERVTAMFYDGKQDRFNNESCRTQCQRTVREVI
ncbi:MAG: serine hydrolase [Planctomycetes bacterium]|nr:serine hydrolase [Planctomycetota bacterium]